MKKYLVTVWNEKNKETIFDQWQVAAKNKREAKKRYISWVEKQIDNRIKKFIDIEEDKISTMGSCLRKIINPYHRKAVVREPRRS